MPVILKIQLPDDSIKPFSLMERKARGFCTCPIKNSDGSSSTKDLDSCLVHPSSVQQSQIDLEAKRLLFFDDRRNRFVTWPDAVEAMRQPRYVGTSSKDLILFTWVNLIHLLEALRYPAHERPAEITEKSAAELVEWAEKHFPSDVLHSLIGFARGGNVEALCKIFQAAVQNVQR